MKIEQAQSKLSLHTLHSNSVASVEDKSSKNHVCDQIFYGGGGEGANSERCLTWGGGVIKESFQKHLEIEGG